MIDKKIVQKGINLFLELNLIEILDGDTFYMTQLQKMVGSETEYAEKKRLQRAKKSRDNVPDDVSDNVSDDVRQENNSILKNSSN